MRNFVEGLKLTVLNHWTRVKLSARLPLHYHSDTGRGTTSCVQIMNGNRKRFRRQNEAKASWDKRGFHASWTLNNKICTLCAGKCLSHRVRFHQISMWYWSLRGTARYIDDLILWMFKTYWLILDLKWQHPIIICGLHCKFRGSEIRGWILTLQDRIKNQTFFIPLGQIWEMFFTDWFGFIKVMLFHFFYYGEKYDLHSVGKKEYSTFSLYEKTLSIWKIFLKTCKFLNIYFTR